MSPVKATLVICFTFFSALARAQEPAAANYTLTRGTAVAENIFTGHYGETLRMASFWTARAEMQGPVEVVYFHPERVDLNDLFSAPFNPGSHEYVPEKFARLQLIQLKVIPMNSPGGPSSLKELREAREKELAAAGVQAKFQTPVGLGSWPMDSFQVMISTPYSLFQAYAAGGKHFFVMTSGTSPYLANSSDPVYLSETESLMFSLLAHLWTFHAPIGSIAEPLTGLPKAFFPGLIACAIGLALFYFPGIFSRTRLAGRGVLALTLGWHLAAIPCMLAAWRFGWGRNINEASLAVCAALLTPWVCREASLRLGGEKSWRVFWFAAVASALPLLGGLAVFDMIHAMEAPIFNADNFGRLSRGVAILGLLNGLALGFAHRGSPVGAK